MFRAVACLMASSAVADEAISLLQTHAHWSNQFAVNAKGDNKVANNRKCASGKIKSYVKSGGLSKNACREVCRMEAQCKFYAHWDKKGQKAGKGQMNNACFLYKGNCIKKNKLNKGNKNELWQIIRTTTTTTLATTTPDPDTTTEPDVASAVGDPHISTVSGEKYDLSKPGHVELITIPAGASAEDALLKVTGETEQMGSREADLWIRRVHVEGRWMGGDDFSFKTGNAKFGESQNYLARMSGGAWLSPRDLLKISDGKMSLALGNQGAPTDKWEKTSNQQVALKAGPVKVLVSYATSKKDTDEAFNHFDVFVSGLSDVEQMDQSMSGVLANKNELTRPRRR